MNPGTLTPAIPAAPKLPNPGIRIVIPINKIHTTKQLQESPSSIKDSQQLISTINNLPQNIPEKLRSGKSRRNRERLKAKGDHCHGVLGSTANRAHGGFLLSTQKANEVNSVPREHPASKEGGAKTSRRRRRLRAIQSFNLQWSLDFTGCRERYQKMWSHEQKLKYQQIRVYFALRKRERDGGRQRRKSDHRSWSEEDTILNLRVWKEVKIRRLGMDRPGFLCKCSLCLLVYCNSSGVVLLSRSLHITSIFCENCISVYFKVLDSEFYLIEFLNLLAIFLLFSMYNMKNLFKDSVCSSSEGDPSGDKQSNPTKGHTTHGTTSNSKTIPGNSKFSCAEKGKQKLQEESLDDKDDKLEQLKIDSLKYKANPFMGFVFGDPIVFAEIKGRLTTFWRLDDLPCKYLTFYSLCSCVTYCTWFEYNNEATVVYLLFLVLHTELINHLFYPKLLHTKNRWRINFIINIPSLEISFNYEMMYGILFWTVVLFHYKKENNKQVQGSLDKWFIMICLILSLLSAKLKTITRFVVSKSKRTEALITGMISGHTGFQFCCRRYFFSLKLVLISALVLFYDWVMKRKQEYHICMPRKFWENNTRVRLMNDNTILHNYKGNGGVKKVIVNKWIWKSKILKFPKGLCIAVIQVNVISWDILFLSNRNGRRSSELYQGALCHISVCWTMAVTVYYFELVPCCCSNLEKMHNLAATKIVGRKLRKAKIWVVKKSKEGSCESLNVDKRMKLSIQFERKKKLSGENHWWPHQTSKVQNDKITRTIGKKDEEQHWG